MTDRLPNAGCTVPGFRKRRSNRATNLCAQYFAVEGRPQNHALNGAMLERVNAAVRDFNRVLDSLVVNPARELEELNSDWTASQELADVLMAQHKAPFRVGHHFASEIVSYAKTNDLKPASFPMRKRKKNLRRSHKGQCVHPNFSIKRSAVPRHTKPHHHRQ